MKSSGVESKVEVTAEKVFNFFVFVVVVYFSVYNELKSC